MTKSHPSPYDNIPALLADEPHKYGRSLSQLDEVNALLAKYKKMDKRSDQGRVDAKPAFFNLLEKFNKHAPKGVLPLNLTRTNDGGIILHAAEAKEPQQAQLFAPEEAAKDAPPEIHKIGDAIYAQRTIIQPKRPRIQLEPEVLKQIHIDLYSPFIRAFAESVAKDRESPSGQRILAGMPHLDQVTREVQGVVAMMDFLDSIDRFRKKLERKAQEQGVDVVDLWRDNLAELKPHLIKICDRFNERIRSLELTVTGQPTGFKLTQTYNACIAAEKSLRNATMDIHTKRARDIVKHHAFEFILGGEDLTTKEHHHKLVHRIEDAYQEDLRVFNKRWKNAEDEHKSAVDKNPRTAGPFNPPNNPLELSLHTLNRVYEARWAMLADEMVTQAKAEFLSNPKVVHPSASPPEGYGGSMIDKRKLAAAQRAALKPQSELTETPVTQVDGVEPQGRTAGAPSAARARGGNPPSGA